MSRAIHQLLAVGLAWSEPRLNAARRTVGQRCTKDHLVAIARRVPHRGDRAEHRVRLALGVGHEQDVGRRPAEDIGPGRQRDARQRHWPAKRQVVLLRGPTPYPLHRDRLTELRTLCAGPDAGQQTRADDERDRDAAIHLLHSLSS